MNKHRPKLKMAHYIEIIPHTNRKDNDVLLFWEVKYAYASCLLY